jgi:hypothetical protein
VPLLVDYFLEHFNRKMNRNVQGTEPDFLDATHGLRVAGQYPRAPQRHRASGGPILFADAFGPRLAGGSCLAPRTGNASPFDSARQDPKSNASFYSGPLSNVKGNKARAADILGMSRGTLYNRLRRYGPPETNGHVNGRSYRNGRNGTS